VAIATRNPGKVKEILEICANWPVRWVTFVDAAMPAVEETGDGYLENARLKAHAIAGALGMPALADDSGIEVDALDGEPGAHSARFAGPDAGDEANLRMLLERVRDTHPERRTARYRCVAVCAWPDGRDVWAEGTCEGRLILDPRGTGGFGYDPAFVPTGLDRTMAELAPLEKNAVSHRGGAFRELRAMLAADLFGPDQTEEP
jgi:XTP/dITP diphosphohydrolase